MRGTKAKRIRRLAYGDKSQREKRRYVRRKDNGQIYVHPENIRARYQFFKRLVKRGVLSV